MLTLDQIKEILPHRYPFLFIDKIIEFEPEKKAVGLKNVTGNEAYFSGHFPGRPIMPGVFIIEAMAQVGGIIIMQMEIARGKLAVLSGADNVRFRDMVLPGDQLLITSELVNIRTKIGKVRSTARVGEKLVAEADILFSLIE